MPSSSKKQHNFMAAVANNPAFAKKAGIPQSVGSEFVKADKGKKFAKGGDMKKIPPFMGKETPAEERKEMGVKAKSKAMYLMGEKAEGVHGKSGKAKPSKYAKGGFTKAADGIAQKGKTKAKRFADGGFSFDAAPFEKGEASLQQLQEMRQSDANRRANPSMSMPIAGRANPAVGQVAKIRAIVDAMKARRPAMRGASPVAARPTMTAAGPNPVGGAMKKGGCVKKMAKGGGCEVKGKTKGRYI